MNHACRFVRLAKGGRKVALPDFQSVPELAGNPFIMRIFQLFDADQDGCLNFEEFIKAVESFGRLYTSEDKCMCKLHSYLPYTVFFNLGQENVCRHESMPKSMHVEWTIATYHTEFLKFAS